MAEWWESAPLASPQGGDDSWWKAAPVYQPPKPSVIEDVAKSVPAGLARGVAGVVGLPGFLQDYVVDPLASAPGRAYNKLFGSGRYEDTPSMAAGRAAVPRYGAGDVLTTENATRAIEGVTGPLYRPQTLPGEIAGTVAEFAPNAVLGGGTAAQRAAQVVVPALASEASGQAARRIAPGFEPAARAAAGLAGGVGTALAQRPGIAGTLIRDAAPDLDQATITAARALIDDAAARGVALTWPEAIQSVTGGGTRLADVQRVVENSAGGGGVMRPFMAQRAGQVERAGNVAVGGLADTALDPVQTGIRAQAAARAAMGDTPEGIRLAERVALNAPRTTADEAGAVIQPALREAYERREGIRAALADRDYTAARNAPANVPLDGGFGHRAVTTYGEAIVTPDAQPRGPLVFPGDEAAAAGGGRPQGPMPETLAQFIARNGGISLERGDTRAAGFDRWTIPFRGRVARPEGRSIDNYWRERLIEEGFLPPDPGGGMARNVHDEVINLLHQERSGRPVYRVADQDLVNERRAAGNFADERAFRLDQAKGDIWADAEAAGIPREQLDPGALERAAERLIGGRGGDPLAAYEQAVMEAAEPAARPAGRVEGVSRTDVLPVVGLSPTRFGQADASAVVQHIDQALATAKGAVKDGLTAARRALLTPAGEVDASITGLHNSRAAITDLIDQAKRAGANNTVRELEGALGTLDQALEAVPAYGAARRNFAAASEPLRPFGESRVPGQIAARDQYGQEFVMPRERAAPALESGGPSAARDFNQVATPEARRAYENYLASRLVDEARDVTGNISADALRRAMARQEDTLRQFPGVVDRLQEIVAARRGMAPVEAGPLGQVAARDQVLEQARALLPNQPAAGLDAAVSQTVRQIVRRDPEAAQNLVRTYAQTVFDEAIQNNMSGPNAFGGAKFAAIVAGNPQQARNLEAAVRSLPNGHARWEGFRRFLDVMEATGQRQPAGSQTAFNQAIQDQLKRGGAVGELGALASSGGTNVPSRLRRWYDELRMGRNTEALARIFTDPASEALLRRLAQEPVGSPRAQGLALRLTYLAGSGDRSGSAQPVR